MDKKTIGDMVSAIQPNYEAVPLVFYYSLGFYKDEDTPEFYKGGLTDNIPKRLYDLRSYVQKRGYAVDFERDPHIFLSWEEAKVFEDTMLEKKDVRTDSPFGYFNGHTELFTTDPLGLAYDERILSPNWDTFWESFDKGHHHPAWGLAGWLFE